MPHIRPRLIALAATLALAPAAWAAEDTPVSTSAPASVAEQIDAYLKSAPPLTADDAGIDGVTLTRPDRQVHGVAEVSVGTGGYRSVYARSDMPVGKTGTLSIAVEDSRSKRGFGGPYRYGGYGGGYRSLDMGLALGGAQAWGERCQPPPYGSADEIDFALSRCRR